MPDYIFTTKDEIQSIVREAVADVFSIHEQRLDIDTMNVDALLAFLAEYGYITTKPQIYQLTSRNKIPFMKLGNKLIFSKKEITNWIKTTVRRPRTKDDALSDLQKHMR